MGGLLRTLGAVGKPSMLLTAPYERPGVSATFSGGLHLQDLTGKFEKWRGSYPCYELLTLHYLACISMTLAVDRTLMIHN